MTKYLLLIEACDNFSLCFVFTFTCYTVLQEALSVFLKKIEDKNLEMGNIKDAFETQVRKAEELQVFLNEREERICDLETQNNLLVVDRNIKADKVICQQNIRAFLY